MRNMWLRIGLGAAFVFVAGMFAVTLGRQVKHSVTDVIQQGGRFHVPLAMLPFEVNGQRVGSVNDIRVEKTRDRVKRINITVKVKDADLAELGDCVVAIGGSGRHQLFDCTTMDQARAEGMIPVGEVRFEPSGVTRPIMIAADRAGEWFDGRDAGQVHLQALDGGGANLLVTDGDGNAKVQIQADSQGASIRVRDSKGRDVVNLQAGSGSVDVKVKKAESTGN